MDPPPGRGGAGQLAGGADVGQPGPPAGNPPPGRRSRGGGLDDGAPPVLPIVPPGPRPANGLEGGGRVCAVCRDLLRSEPCPGCGSWRRLRRRPDGTRSCLACAAPARRPAKKGPAEECPACGAAQRLSRTRPDGTRICRPCDQRETAEWLRGWRAHFRRSPSRRRLRRGPEANDQARIGWIVEAVSAADPGLAESQIRAALSRVVPSPTARSPIAQELLWWPQQLLTGRADMSMPVPRLVKELIAGGSTGVRRPSCTLCRRVRDLPTPLPGGGRICGACKRHLDAEQCPGCDRWRPVAIRLSDGTVVCSVCAGGTLAGGRRVGAVVGSGRWSAAPPTAPTAMSAGPNPTCPAPAAAEATSPGGGAPVGCSAAAARSPRPGSARSAA